nr:ATP-binding cassette domain-containing protein [Natronospira proteinivora]
MRVDKLIAGYTGPVVGPVSFDVQPGEVLGLSGPNGAGKSTLLKAITGAATTFEGRVEPCNGLTVTHHQQRPELPPELPLLGRELLRVMAADRSDAPEIIQPLLSRPINRMSGGQFQLLEAWACLGGDAELVLLDEPTNNLDGDAVEALSAFIRAARPPRAILLVSHEREFLNQNCTRIVEVSS